MDLEIEPIAQPVWGLGRVGIWAGMGGLLLNKTKSTYVGTERYPNDSTKSQILVN